MMRVGRWIMVREYGVLGGSDAGCIGRISSVGSLRVVLLGLHGSVPDGKIDFQQGKESGEDGKEVSSLDHATIGPLQSTEITASKRGRWPVIRRELKFEDQVNILDPHKQHQHCWYDHQQSTEVLVKSSGNDLVGVYVGEKEYRRGDDQSPVLPEKELLSLENDAAAGACNVVDVVVAPIVPVLLFGVVRGDDDEVDER